MTIKEKSLMQNKSLTRPGLKLSNIEQRSNYDKKTNPQTNKQAVGLKETNNQNHLACNKMALSPAEHLSSSSCSAATNLPLVPEQ